MSDELKVILGAIEHHHGYAFTQALREEIVKTEQAAYSRGWNEGQFDITGGC